MMRRIREIEISWHGLDGWEANFPGGWGNHFLTPWGAWLWACRIMREQ